MRISRYLKIVAMAIAVLILIMGAAFAADIKNVAPDQKGNSTLQIPGSKKAVPIIPFYINFYEPNKFKYMAPFSLQVRLIPTGDMPWSQYQIDAVAGKKVHFYIDGKFVGEAISNGYGRAELQIPENTSRNLNLQVTGHIALAKATHNGHVIEGKGLLSIDFADTKMNVQYIMPSKNRYKIGETISLGAILTASSSYNSPTFPVARVIVNCASFEPTDSKTFEKKIISSGLTNDQGGFECKITLSPDMMVGQRDGCYLGYIGASFNTTRNYNRSFNYREIWACQ